MTVEKAGRMPIRAFLFDLGNVLVRFDHLQAALKILDGKGGDPEQLRRFFFDSPLVVEHDEGRISTQGFYEGFRRLTGAKLSYDRFLEVWTGIFSADSKMLALLESLLDRYPCYLISNTNRPHFEFIRRKWPVLDRMAGWILSYEVGHLKPHPTIYRRALERVGLPAQEILYVDDREDLIEAGRALGFQVHWFVGIGAFEKDLRAKGVRLPCGP